MTNILIADDDRIIREKLVEIFENEGHKVQSAENGKEVLEKINNEKFDLILLDLIMPDVEGMDLLGEIRKKDILVPVIMITAFATVETAVRAIKKGATDYVAKPFKTQEIEMAARRALQKLEFQRKVLEESPENIKDVFDCLSNSLRREVLIKLMENRMTFTDIQKSFEISDPSKLNFHMRKLKESNLISQDDKRQYHLTPKGKDVYLLITKLGMSI